MDADRNAIFLESIEHMIALWTQDPPYRLKGKRWQLSTERTWIAGPRHGRDAEAVPEAASADRGHRDPAGLERHRGRGGARGWTPISANFVHPWVVKTHWPKYVEGCARAGREAQGEDWRVAKSIFVADDEATVRRMTRDPGNPFAYYFRNLQRKAQATARQRAFQARARRCLTRR